MNARFWTYLNGGAVKLTLQEDESFTWRSFEYTDEGWNSEQITWTYENGVIRREWESCGRDCDGRLDQYGAQFCLVEHMQAGNTYEQPAPIGWITYPKWEEVDSWQRDEFAEAAGY